MEWVNWDFYKETYRMNTAAVIPETVFPLWEKKARQKINHRHIEFETVPEVIKECVCEVAEYLYNRDKANDPSAIKSYSNDGYSETYVDPRKSVKEELIEIREIIHTHLSDTDYHNDFIYSGA